MAEIFRSAEYARAKLEAPVIVIDEIGGNCPVQAEGTINGKRFYFRARWGGWRLEVHPTATGGYLHWPEDGKEWDYSEAWGEDPYAAGWMTEVEARKLIAKAAALYAGEKQ